MKLQSIGWGISILLVACAGQMLAQETGNMARALAALNGQDQQKPDFGFVGDEVGADVELNEIRFVGNADTGSGMRRIFVVRFHGVDRFERTVEIVRVVYLDTDYKFDFVHSIGCGCRDVKLVTTDSGPVTIQLGPRSYRLGGKDWKEPLIEQQSYC